MLASTIVTEMFGNILSLQRTMAHLGGASRGTVRIFVEVKTLRIFLEFGKNDGVGPRVHWRSFRN